MIADVVNLAIMAIAFCYAAGRLLLHRGFAAGLNNVLARNRGWDHRRARAGSALTEDL
jgi:hypothetical protein